MGNQRRRASDREARRTRRTVLIIVAVVLAVCSLGGLAGGFWLYRTYQDAAGPARSATVAYIDDVRAGNYQSAYGRLCTSVRESTPREEYIRIQSAQLKIESYEVEGVSVSSYNGRVSATVTVRLAQETGAELSQTFPLLKEDGEWRICQ
jgi:hypothetical protein